VLATRLETNRKIGNVDGIAAAHWGLATIELRRGKVVEAAPQLAEAWSLFTRLGRADGIAAIGEIFGQVLVAAGQRDQAIAILRRSVEAYRKLGREERAHEVEALVAAARG
jgi:hypothetical protein